MQISAALWIAAIIVATTAPAFAEARSDVILYAQIKEDAPLRTTRQQVVQGDSVIPYPMNGVVIGGFHALPGATISGGDFIIVDFDARSTKLLTIEWKAESNFGGKSSVHVVGQSNKALTIDELNRIIEQANRAWSHKGAPSIAHIVMDYFDGITILSGNDVLRGQGPAYADAWPDLQQSVKRLWPTFRD